MDWGFALTEIRDNVIKFIDKQGKPIHVFRDNIAGPDFIDLFTTRNYLSIRLASNIKRSKSQLTVRIFYNSSTYRLYSS